MNLIPFGPSSLMCLRLFMDGVTPWGAVEQGNQRLLTKNSKPFISLDCLSVRGMVAL